MPSSNHTTYRELFQIPTFPRLATGVLLARTASQMMLLTLVLFVLQRFHSPSLAGITVFLSIAPGVALSPIAGALLDRHGRVRLITLDYLVGAVTLSLIAGLDFGGRLTPWVLLPIVAVSSLTYSLSNSGARSLLPLIVPKRLWDRANALDSIAYALTMGAGPASAGALTAWAGPRLALTVTAAVFLVAAVVIVRLPEPVVGNGSRPVFAEAWAGLKYVLVHNTALRGIALVVSIMNLGFGVLLVALPVMVLQRLHGDPALVGVLWAAFGLASVPSALIAGRINSEGRERLVMIVCDLVAGLAVAVLAFAGNAWIVAAMMLIAGLSNGPFDVSMFSMRQRRTDPAWYGRAFAVSMGLNWGGQPIGSAISGPLIHIGLTSAFLVAAAFMLLAAGMVRWVIPAEHAGTIAPESARQSRRDRPVEESPSSAEQGAG
ncbi:MAG TPA: MFS transporter [Candidatus Dormibacteraeota bacterium]|nr:MFS transporter [Candidatus Dormibacteraeota bacterium]